MTEATKVQYPRLLIPNGQIISSDYMKAARKKAGITGSRQSKKWRKLNQMPPNVAIVGHVKK